MKTLILIIIGLVTGFINGIFGSGGGSIIVPALEKFINIKTHKAHATSISIILPITMVSAFIYFKNVNLDLSIILYISIGGLLGGYIGAKFLNKISGNILHKIFGLFMIIAAVRLIL